MSTFFPNNLDDLIQDPQFRSLFVIDPMMVSTGIYYGFPACCVEHFCVHGRNLNHSAYQNHPMSGTGYVPCPQCLEMSKDKETFSEYINANRYCSDTFPSQQINLIDVELHKFFSILCYRMYNNPLAEIKSYSMLSYLVNEIDKSNPIYLYIKGFKINVSAIGLSNKEEFSYMVENNHFCNNQLESILAWQELLEASAGIVLPKQDIWTHIYNGEFNLVHSPENIPQTQANSPRTYEKIETANLIVKKKISYNHFESIMSA